MLGLNRLFIYLLFLILMCSGKTEVYAQSYDFLGDAGGGTYTITMKKIRISDGTTWVTLAEAEQSFNIASQSVGASIGSYISNVSIPEGTYTQIEITQSRMITIQGQGTNAGTTYYTTTQNGTVGGGTATFYKATTVAAQYEAVPFQVPSDATAALAGETLTISGDDMIITKDMSSTPIVISKGQKKSMAISFNTESMIGFEEAPAGSGNYIFFPMPPQQTYSEE